MTSALRTRCRLAWEVGYAGFKDFGVIYNLKGAILKVKTVKYLFNVVIFRNTGIFSCRMKRKREMLLLASLAMTGVNNSRVRSLTIVSATLANVSH